MCSAVREPKEVLLFPQDDTQRSAVSSRDRNDQCTLMLSRHTITPQDGSVKISTP